MSDLLVKLLEGTLVPHSRIGTTHSRTQYRAMGRARGI